MKKLALALLCSALLGSVLAQEPGWSPVQNEVWQREETYWKMVIARDDAGYLDLWDESFVGWPSFERSPSGKDSFRAMPFGPTSSWTSSYKFEQREVHTHGETIITFLQVRLTQSENGQVEERIVRLTHAWQKHDGIWRIVSGMSCIVRADGIC